MKSEEIEAHFILLKNISQDMNDDKNDQMNVVLIQSNSFYSSCNIIEQRLFLIFDL